MTTHRRRRANGDRGAALVEFALVFPIFMMIVLGMFTGGLSWNRKITITNAAREASRYGATLPVANFGAPFPSPAATSLEAWLVSVADAVQQNASGEVDAGVTGRSICVAYVHPEGTTAALPNDQTRRVLRTTGTDAFSSANCFTDGRPANERRVQIRVTRPSAVRGLFFTINLNLATNSLSRFEATT